MGFIYKITNNINGKFYIGKTSRLINWRFSTHKSASISPKDYFHRALKKYGCEKLSKSNKGKNTWTKNKKWWNNGIECKYCENQPEGFVKGRLPNHKRGLTPGLEVGTKLNITDEERKRRSENMKKIKNGTL